MKVRKICDDVPSMGMFELVHNHVFVKDKEVWYRDFEREIPARDLLREIYRKHLGAEAAEEIADDDTFDDILLEAGYYGTDELEGVFSLLYTTFWGMADVREWLKDYENSGIPAIKRPEVLKEAISAWGIHAQVDMAIEEMSELTKVLCKERRCELKQGVHAEAQENVIEKIADVFIMLAQLLIIFDKDKEVQAAINYKIDRLAQRLGKAAQQSGQTARDPADYL